jgi:cell division septal protein FtsQ
LQGERRSREVAERRVVELERELRDLNQQFDAIDLLASRGYQARKRPGPKKIKNEEVAA